MKTHLLKLRKLEGLDKELRTISGSLRSAISKSIAKQVDIDRENRKLEEMANDEHIRTSKEKKCELDCKGSKMNKSYEQSDTHFERSILQPNLSDKRIDHEILGQRNGYTW